MIDLTKCPCLDLKLERFSVNQWSSKFYNKMSGIIEAATEKVSQFRMMLKSVYNKKGFIK